MTGVQLEFSEMRNLQQHSNDIAIYAPMIDQLVTIAWSVPSPFASRHLISDLPTRPMESGQAVSPFALVGWLNRHEAFIVRVSAA